MKSILETQPGSDQVDAPLDRPAVAAHPASAAELSLTIIEPRPGWQLVDFGELWRYRELLFFLIWRDVKVRYKQTALGVGWAVLQPFVTMVVFTLFLGRLNDRSKLDYPYSVFVFAGLLPWIFFSNAIANAAQSIIGSTNLVTKIYFPRIIIPLGAIGATLVDFVIGFFMLFAIMLFYGVLPGWGFVLVPFISFLILLAALGMGTLLSALTVAYRDFRYVVPFMLQTWMFATPCIYMTPSAVESRWRYLLPLNPAYGLIKNFRIAALGGAFDVPSLAISTAVTLVILLVGCTYFRKVESTFADII